MTDAVVDQSKTSPIDQVEGKQCVVGRFISPAEASKILIVADTWVGTEYAAVGGKSEKGVRGDCSGTTNKIYTEAGFPYPYRRTADFIAYTEESNRFREIDLTKEKAQVGDVLWWPGHMAIYADFPEGDPRRNTGVVKQGKAKTNNMFTAFNLGGRPYGPYNAEVFRGDKYRVFRYYLKDAKTC